MAVCAERARGVAMNWTRAHEHVQGAELRDAGAAGAAADGNGACVGNRG